MPQRMQVESPRHGWIVQQSFMSKVQGLVSVEPPSCLSVACLEPRVQQLERHVARTCPLVAAGPAMSKLWASLRPRLAIIPLYRLLWLRSGLGRGMAHMAAPHAQVQLWLHISTCILVVPARGIER